MEELLHLFRRCTQGSMTRVKVRRTTNGLDDPMQRPPDEMRVQTGETESRAPMLLGRWLSGMLV